MWKPPAAERAVYRAIKDGHFPPAYYFSGDDDFLKEVAVRDLLAAAIDPATQDFNRDVVRGNEVSAESLEALLNTPPMMADRRAVVIRDVPALRKDARQVLERYLSSPATDMLLLLVAPAGATFDKTLGARATPVEFTPPTGDDLLGALQEYATTLGTSLSMDAAELLVKAVGQDLRQLTAEVQKLANYTGNRVIDSEAVTAVVGVRHGETLSDLLDAVARRDARSALAILPVVLENPRVGAVVTIMALSTQTLGLAWGRALRDRGVAAHAMEREFFTLLRETGANVWRPWGEAVKSWASALPQWDGATLQQAVNALLEADRAAKETRMSSEEQLLGTLILSMCGHRGVARGSV